MKKFNISFLNLMVLMVAFLLHSCNDDGTSPAPDLSVGTNIVSFNITAIDGVKLKPVIAGAVTGDTIKVALVKGSDRTKLKVALQLANDATFTGIDTAAVQDLSTIKDLVVKGKKATGKDSIKTYKIQVTFIPAKSTVTGISFVKVKNKLFIPEETTVSKLAKSASGNEDSITVVVPAGTKDVDLDTAYFRINVPAGATYTMANATKVADTIPTLYFVDLKKLRTSGSEVTATVTGGKADGTDETPKTFNIFLSYKPQVSVINRVWVTKYGSTDVNVNDQKAGKPDASKAIAIVVPKGTALNPLTIKLDVPSGVDVSDNGGLTPDAKNPNVLSGDFSSTKTIKVKGKDKNNNDVAEATYTITVTAAP